MFFFFQKPFSKQAVDHVQTHLAKKQVPASLFQVRLRQSVEVFFTYLTVSDFVYNTSGDNKMVLVNILCNSDTGTLKKNYKLLFFVSKTFVSTVMKAYYTLVYEQNSFQNSVILSH